MAYKTDLNIRCGDCNNAARYEVFNRFNASMGKFCSTHAQTRLALINKIEQGDKPENDDAPRKES